MKDVMAIKDMPHVKHPKAFTKLLKGIEKDFTALGGLWVSTVFDACPVEIWVPIGRKVPSEN